MAVADPPRRARDRALLDVSVAPSAAVELHWVTMTDPSGAMRIAHPSVSGWARRPDLVAACGELWGVNRRRNVASNGERSLPELLVLADRAGVLAETDVDVLLSGLRRSAGRGVGDLALASETPEDREIILGRLQRLRTDRTLRRAWLELLAEVAALIRESWEDTGLDLSRRAARARASQLPWTDPAEAVLGWARRDYDGLLPELLGAAAQHGRPVLVVPAYWSGNGLLFDLDEHLLVGIPAQLGPSDSRVRTERWVRGVKALADPTRLAMLDYLGGTSRSISDVAADFGLAQPTASRHVRLLREAGLVTETRHGSTVMVAADVAGLGRLIGGLAETFVERDRRPSP